MMAVYRHGGVSLKSLTNNDNLYFGPNTKWLWTRVHFLLILTNPIMYPDISFVSYTCFNLNSVGNL